MQNTVYNFKMLCYECQKTVHPFPMKFWIYLFAAKKKSLLPICYPTSYVFAQ